jgi:hypothetical protein
MHTSNRFRLPSFGVAQEKESIWKSWGKRRRAIRTWIAAARWPISVISASISDSEWGAAFWKTNAYSPWPIWLWLRGHEWAKCQLEGGGVA